MWLSNLPRELKRFTIIYSALQFFYYFAFFWLIQNVYMLEHGISYTELSIILAVWSAAIILLEIPSGMLADRIGRKPVIVIGKIGFLLAMILYAIFPSFWGFIAVVILIGVHESFISGAQEALLFDTFQLHNQSDQFKKTLSIATTSREIGLGSGVLIAGLITSLGVQYNLIGSIVIAAIGVVLSLMLSEQSRATSSEEQTLLSTLRVGLKNIRNRFELKRIVLFSAIVMVSYVVISEYFVVSLRELKTPYPLVGAMAALEAIFFTLGSYLAHKIHSKRNTLVYSILSLSMAIGMFAISRGTIVIVIAAWMFLRVVKAIGEIVSTDDWQQYVGSNERATSISINSFIKNIVYIPLAILFGKLSDSIGLFHAFAAIAVFAASFLVVQIIARKKSVNTAPPQGLTMIQ